MWLAQYQTWNKWWWRKKDVILTLNFLFQLDSTTVSVRYCETRHLHDSVSFGDALWKSGFKVINAFNCCPRFLLSHQIWHDRYTTVESVLNTLLLQQVLLCLWFWKHIYQGSQNPYTDPKLSLHTGACMNLSQFLLEKSSQCKTSAKPEQI